MSRPAAPTTAAMTTPSSPAPGRLVLMPNTLDLATTPTPITDVLSAGALARAASLGHWVVENAKSSRAFLKRVDAVQPLRQPLQALHLQELPRARKGSGEDVGRSAWEALLAPALAGHDLGLLSDAGLPAVADPGAALVEAAHRLGLVVEPWAGASSLTMALAASGLNGQRFAFEGYLPQEAEARARRIRALEARSLQEGQTQLAIETPYRNNTLMTALLDVLKPSTRLSVACGLTSAEGSCRTRSVADWRAMPVSTGSERLPTHLPAVFMWLAG
jgi:16S rRNA (cytidine1402-2'-O)-methyltransferase